MRLRWAIGRTRVERDGETEKKPNRGGRMHPVDSAIASSGYVTGSGQSIVVAGSSHTQNGHKRSLGSN